MQHYHLLRWYAPARLINERTPAKKDPIKKDGDLVTYDDGSRAIFPTWGYPDDLMSVRRRSCNRLDKRRH